MDEVFSNTNKFDAGDQWLSVLKRTNQKEIYAGRKSLENIINYSISVAAATKNDSCKNYYPYKLVIEKSA